MQCTEHQSRQAPASAWTAWVLPVPGGPCQRISGAAARPAGGEEAAPSRGAPRAGSCARSSRHSGTSIARRPRSPWPVAIQKRIGTLSSGTGSARSASARRSRRATRTVSRVAARRRRCRSTRARPASRAIAAVVERERRRRARSARTRRSRRGRARARRRDRRPSRGTSILCDVHEASRSTAARKTCSTSGLTQTSVASPDSSVRVRPAARSSERSSRARGRAARSLSAGTGMSARAGGFEPPPSHGDGRPRVAAGEWCGRAGSSRGDRRARPRNGCGASSASRMTDEKRIAVQSRSPLRTVADGHRDGVDVRPGRDTRRPHTRARTKPRGQQP